MTAEVVELLGEAAAANVARLEGRDLREGVQFPERPQADRLLAGLVEEIEDGLADRIFFAVPHARKRFQEVFFVEPHAVRSIE